MSVICKLAKRQSAVIVVLLLAAASARADAERPPAYDTRVREPSIIAWRLQVYPMLVHADDEGFAVGVGTTAFMLLAPIELGASVGAETQALGYSRASVAAHLGLRGQLERIELDGAVTAGLSAVHTPGGFLNDDPGASGGIGFMGGRVGFGYRLVTFGRSATHLSLGCALSYEHDLNPYEVTYTYQDTPWFSFDGDTSPYERAASATIGSNRIALMLAITLGID